MFFISISNLLFYITYLHESSVRCVTNVSISRGSLNIANPDAFIFTDKNFIPSESALYEDITDDVLDVAYQLDTKAIIHNLKQIYRHILDKDVVFEVGSVSEISGKASSVPCIYPVGRLRQKYPRNSTTLLMFLYDGRLAEQSINLLGLLPGEYKASCKGEPCTIVVWEKTSGIYNQGVVFYDDDKDAAEEIVYIKNRV